MARILYLVHRMPYPPNKGDKVRSYHLLRHLAARHEVYLGTFVDDPADEPHAEVVAQWCREVKAVRIRPAWSRLASARALLRGEPLSVAYYRSAAMRHWVTGLRRRVRPDLIVAYSSTMAQYVHGGDEPLLMDLVDLDSEKWSEYAKAHRWPWSWIYAREARLLLEVEAAAVDRACFASFVTGREVDLFGRRTGGTRAGHVHIVGNGVDAEAFDPERPYPDPFRPGVVPIVFTGAMDYMPNVDAVRWFCGEILPHVLSACPRAHLYIVGRHPTRAVRQLGGAAVTVTGAVEDVRPFLAHAAAAVAPMRMARGIHNKILEAMAMATPLVVTDAAADSLEPPVRELVDRASDAAGFAAAVVRLLRDLPAARLRGQSGRRAVVQAYRWGDRFQALDHALSTCLKVQ